MESKNCVFCAIIEGKMPVAKVFESEAILCFMDKYPINTGHTLVIPKKHYESFLDMSENEVAELYITVSRIAKASIKSLHADGFNVGQNNGRAANQIVPHVHVHIIPRFISDNNNGRWPSRKIESQHELEIAAGKISRYY